MVEFSKEQKDFWLSELIKTYPNIDEGFLSHILNMYSAHPELLHNLVKEYKDHPDEFKAKKFEELKYTIDKMD
tara:strand:- start:385 stop:603 length:219 start_codon:yes stop_codon:yes gene_type:complete